MAGGEPVKIMGYEFTARPLSRWRCLTLDFFPYWQASRPGFVLTVKRLESASQSQRFRWFVRFANSDVTGEEETICPLATGETASFIIGKKFLAFTGDSLITLPADLVSPPPNAYEAVYAFHTTPKTWFALVAAAAFLAGLFAALCHWLLG